MCVGGGGLHVCVGGTVRACLHVCVFACVCVWGGGEGRRGGEIIAALLCKGG